ncbi:MAG: Rieske 2Fe-2S domain-containing protein [Nitrospira sp.]|jgi:nitrite reductase (NADH) small subunit|nr:Rieske 2Fe-2S domain-containing protein [Nitrospira sp.]MBH0198116.1 Rieske 2Fe-2S domain-containing protein [Nitrospira sp.]MDX2251196.1 Rieske 2Fe-2S domain-containing protein [Nitrospira sp.]
MEGFQKVAQLDDLAPGRSKKVTVNDRVIALFNVDGKFYAIHNSCPHEGGPLAEGRLKGYVVACPWHDLAFDIRNGQGTDGGGYCVGSYEVRVEGTDIWVGPRRKI